MSPCIVEIDAFIHERGLSLTQAAAILGVDQPQVWALLNGRLSGFSMDRLVRFLLTLDRDVRITVRPKQDDRAHVIVA